MALEDPLEIRLQGTPLAVVMRTPGDDEDLVTGFLLTGMATFAALGCTSCHSGPNFSGPTLPAGTGR